MDQHDVDRIFHALADHTRRDILTRVMPREHSVSYLAQRYSMSFAAIQKQVAGLERAHLVAKKRSGREQLVSGDVATIRAAARLLDQFEQIWRDRVDRIDALFSAPTDGGTP